MIKRIAIVVEGIMMSLTIVMFIYSVLVVLHEIAMWMIEP